MNKMKRFIDILVPVTSCNLSCHYCYLDQNGRKGSKVTPFQYSAEHIGKALSKKRLGGVCHFNMCGWGETLIPQEIVPIVRAILEQGHYVWIVTNGLLTNRINELMDFPEELRKRLGLKFSYHYLELIRTKQIEKFFTNVKNVKKHSCSFSIEVTPSDELIPYIEEIKEVTFREVGAWPHITVARTEKDPEIPILTKLSKEEYQKIWGVFKSDMFDFKMSLWGDKREEYCYAGCWSGLLNLGNGDLRACYESRLHQNIFKDIHKPIHFVAIGRHCNMPHCYNAHSFLALGNIPEINTYTYAQIRNRVCDDGSEWLNPKMKAFISQRLEDNNKEFGIVEKATNEIMFNIKSVQRIIKKKHEIRMNQKKVKNAKK